MSECEHKIKPVDALLEDDDGASAPYAVAVGRCTLCGHEETAIVGADDPEYAAWFVERFHSDRKAAETGA